MKLKMTIIAISLILSPTLYAGGDVEIFYRSQPEEYNYYRVRGYDIQPPVPVDWYAHGCRAGDYNCLKRYGCPRVYHNVPIPDLVRDIR